MKYEASSLYHLLYKITPVDYSPDQVLGFCSFLVPESLSYIKARTAAELHIPAIYMESEKRGEATAISIQEPKSDAKGKGVFRDAAAPVFKVAANATRRGERGKGLAIFDLTLRLSAITAGFAATAIMGTTEQTLPFFTQFFQFHAQFNDIPTLMLFVILNAVASGYLVLSLPFSIICIIRPQSTGPRLLLIMFDTVVMALTIAAVSAATAILSLAHNGNQNTNWIPICQQFIDFCQQASSAAVASFVASFMFILLILLSAVALKRK